jgi:CDP-glucose 4,6-dehydratase
MEMTNKNVLVTGGTGFIGSHLVEELTKLGITPIVIYRTLYPRSYFVTQKLADKVILIHQDINNFSGIFRIITKYQIDIVFHLAAQAMVATAYINPLDTLSTNIIGTANILEACRLYGHTQAIIVASSDKAYGKRTKVKYIESDPLQGDHPYEVSKSACDLVTQTYHKTYKMPISITRFGNVYGEGDMNFSRIIPGIMESLIKKQILEIRSNGKFVRDYIYVKDVVIGYLTIVQHWQKTRGEAFNFGSRETLSVLDLIKLAENTLQIKIKYRILNQTQNEITYQSLNFSKVRRLTGWQPQYSLSQTLPQIFKWHQNYF